MISDIMRILSGKHATLFGGLMLLLSFALFILRIDAIVDPAWIALLISGIPLAHLAAWRIVYNRGISKISSALLITMAMIAAVWIGDVFAAGEVAFIMALGAILEEHTVERAKRRLKELTELTPQVARRVVGGEEEQILQTDIVTGDVLRILPGETIPADGIILKGSTSVDQSAMTGESLPADKSVGDDVFGGTVNRFGSIEIRATRTGEDASIRRLIRLVRNAEKEKAPIQRTADKWASVLVPVALAIAICVYLVTGEAVRAVTVLVVFCPCALVLATPVAVTAAVGHAARNGVIVKTGDALERMAKVDCVAFDKTGTLTKGEVSVDSAISFGSASADDVLKTAASVESQSEHPLAKAIVRHVRENKMKYREATDFRSFPGLGTEALCAGSRIRCGRAQWAFGSRHADTCSAVSEIMKSGAAVVAVSSEGEPMGAIALSDTVRDSAQEAVGNLKSMGLKTVMLTGDNEYAAGSVSEIVGIGDFYAELLPEGKVSAIKAMGDAGRHVCMIGDGVNDAPALKTAYVGMAMGTFGSDMAVESADIAIMGDDPGKVAYVKKLADATLKTIKAGIILSLAINFVAISVSALGFLTPTVGALVHNAGSITVVLLAATLYDRKIV